MPLHTNSDGRDGGRGGSAPRNNNHATGASALTPPDVSDAVGGRPIVGGDPVAGLRGEGGGGVGPGGQPTGGDAEPWSMMSSFEDLSKSNPGIHARISNNLTGRTDQIL